MSTEIDELKKDMAYFFKWLVAWNKYEQAIIKKNNSVKAQNFEMAVRYREEEKKIHEEWETIVDELRRISEKYLTPPTP